MPTPETYDSGSNANSETWDFEGVGGAWGAIMGEKASCKGAAVPLRTGLTAVCALIRKLGIWVILGGLGVHGVR